MGGWLRAADMRLGLKKRLQGKGREPFRPRAGLSFIRLPRCRGAGACGQGSAGRSRRRHCSPPAPPPAGAQALAAAGVGKPELFLGLEVAEVAAGLGVIWLVTRGSAPLPPDVLKIDARCGRRPRAVGSVGVEVFTEPLRAEPQ